MSANDPKWADNFGWEPSPGTTGIFKVITDSFGLPKGAKNPEGTKDWLRLIGSPEGQKAFNLAKGSIPARTDVPPDGFPPYQQSAMKDFKSNTIVSSIARRPSMSNRNASRRNGSISRGPVQSFW